MCYRVEMSTALETRDLYGFLRPEWIVYRREGRAYRQCEQCVSILGSAEPASCGRARERTPEGW